MNWQQPRTGAFSVNKFYGDLQSQGIAVAKNTLHSYLAHLEDAFLLRTLSIATDSERRRMVNPCKAYPIDPGLIPVFDRSGKANLGHALETCVLLELDRRGAEVSYVHTPSRREVDSCALPLRQGRIDPGVRQPRRYSHARAGNTGLDRIGAAPSGSHPAPHRARHSRGYRYPAWHRPAQCGRLDACER